MTAARNRGRRTANVKTHLVSSQVSYKRKFRWANFCVYCGDEATCLDHVMPITVAYGLDTTRPGVRRGCKQGLNMIPSCKECNILAGYKKFLLIREKRAYIQSRLKKKYKRVLARVIWEDDELDEIGYNIRTKIESMQSKRAWLELRTTWPNSSTIVPAEQRQEIARRRFARPLAALTTQET